MKGRGEPCGHCPVGRTCGGYSIATAAGPLISHMGSGKMEEIVISSNFLEFSDIPTLNQLGYQQDLLGVWVVYYSSGGIPTPTRGILASAIEKIAHD